MGLNRKAKNGFTLIETMISVSIIGVLAAVSVPTFNKYLYDAREVEGTQTLLNAYKDQKQVSQECEIGTHYVNPVTGRSNCSGGINFTQLYDARDSSFPTMLYRVPENANFKLITGAIDTSVQTVSGAVFVSNSSSSSSAATQLATVNNNQFGYAAATDTSGNLFIDHAKFMMGAQSVIGGNIELLAVNQNGTLLKLCDAATGGNGPDVNFYGTINSTPPTCGAAATTSGSSGTTSSPRLRGR